MTNQRLIRLLKRFPREWQVTFCPADRQVLLPIGDGVIHVGNRIVLREAQISEKESLGHADKG